MYIFLANVFISKLNREQERSIHLLLLGMSTRGLNELCRDGDKRPMEFHERVFFFRNVDRADSKFGSFATTGTPLTIEN